MSLLSLSTNVPLLNKSITIKETLLNGIIFLTDWPLIKYTALLWFVPSYEKITYSFVSQRANLLLKFVNWALLTRRVHVVQLSEVCLVSINTGVSMGVYNELHSHWGTANCVQQLHLTYYRDLLQLMQYVLTQNW